MTVETVNIDYSFIIIPIIVLLLYCKVLMTDFKYPEHRGGY